MKVYFFISKEKRGHKMYLPYIETLNKNLDITTTSMTDADIVLLMGAWTMEGARLAKQARRMDIPYIVCPLGDLSEYNCKSQKIKRSLQKTIYLKTMYRKAEAVVATTPMEQEYLTRLGWNKNVLLVRYFGYSHLASEQSTTDEWNATHDSSLANHEKRKADRIASLTKDPIVAQILQIKSRMPHKYIPQPYLDDLNTLLYADNYDEDTVNEELRKLKIDTFAASVFQAMTEKTGLTDGFMPLPAKKSRKSREILTYVKK